jgi:hypothetical protein
MFLPDLWIRVARLVERATLHGKEGKAKRIADAYLRLRPRDPEAWLIRYRVARNFESTGEQEEYLRLGQARNPSSMAIKAASARFLIEYSRLDEAALLVEEFLHTEPSSPVGYGLAAEIARLRGEDRRVASLAEEVLRRADVEENTEHHETLVALGVTLLHSEAWQPHARKVLEKAANPNWPDPRPHMLLALLLKDRNPEASRKHLRRARHFWLGGDFEQEMQHWEASFKETKTGH